MKDWDARLYRDHTGFVSELGEPVVELLGPRAGERILDIGCGDGVLTERIAGFGCDITAVDASEDMVRAAGTRGIDARLMDATRLEFESEFDAVFSNAALHWIQPMEAVIEGVYRALKPGGRFVAEFGGRGNVKTIRNALHAILERRGIAASVVDPWHFPSPGEYRAMLDSQGFRVESIEHFDRPTALPGGIADWIESVGRPFLQALPPGDRRSFLEEVELALAPVLRGKDGVWRADYVRLRGLAVKAAAA